MIPKFTLPNLANSWTFFSLILRNLYRASIFWFICHPLGTFICRLNSSKNVDKLFRKRARKKAIFFNYILSVCVLSDCSCSFLFNKYVDRAIEWKRCPNNFTWHNLSPIYSLLFKIFRRRQRWIYLSNIW